MTAPRCSGPCAQGRAPCRCRNGELPTINLDITPQAKPRRGPVTHRTTFLLRHPTLVTCALLALILGALLLTSEWDYRALQALAGAR